MKKILEDIADNIISIASVLETDINNIVSHVAHVLKSSSTFYNNNHI
jgi:hypothetical protein